MTLDAVATEAGVSKATVLYEHASKRELVAALVRRTIEADNDFYIRCSHRYDGEADAALRGRIEAARQASPPQGGNPAVLSLIAALMQDAALRAEFRANQAELREVLLRDATDSRRTRLAWLALEGLKFQQHMDLVPWSPDEVRETLDDIEALVAKEEKP